MRNTTTTPRPANAYTVSAWDVVVACLCFSGTCTDLVSPELSRRARLVADGFGDLGPTVTRNPHGLEADAARDWSHVRDSSPEAIQRVHRVLVDGLGRAGKLHELMTLIRERGASEAI